ncbi:MAG TPA: hypothetical protein VGR95_11640 [Thermoanaerobaculia bacterium]|jgi:hypothetical protein|nr:hypothetical protein [Thermoanaerobaculia bacterium]
MKFAIAFALAVFSYHFEENVTGYHPHVAEGSVLVSGSQWRLDHRDIVSTAQIGGDGQDVIAINDSNQTWYSLHSRAGMSITSMLFTYPMKPSVSRVKVGFSDGTKTHLLFSYELTFTIANEKVRGRVWGGMRIWTRAGDEKLPWSPITVATGLDEVDAAFRTRLSEVQGQAWKSETEVSRQIENGETLHQVITRTAGDVGPATAKPELFKVPAGYREQPPIIGAPGK